MLKTCAERFYVIDSSGFAFPLPQTLEPSFWLSDFQPSVYGFPMSPKQTRTDDRQRVATALLLEGDIEGRVKTEQGLMEQSHFIRSFVMRAAWLQRGTWGLLKLLPGSDITLKASGKQSKKGKLGVMVVAEDRRWIGPDGREVL